MEISAFFYPSLIQFLLCFCTKQAHHSLTLWSFRKANPGTELGEPGPLQGVNSGVALLHLDRMRTSPALAHYLHPGTMDQLCAKFQFQGWLAEQVEVD